MILNIHKPPGPTSHDIVDEVRRITGERRVGHAGTLDPFAEGVLIVLVGKEDTKRQREFMEMEKEYVAKIRLGAISDTDDATGIIQKSKLKNKKHISKLKMRQILNSFTGTIEQVPPAYSAKKIRGKKAYELARRGEALRLAPKKVTIHAIELLNYNWPILDIRVTCSSGTYIRALARDIGEKLRCGAYLESLTRTRIGPFTREKSKTIDQVRREW